MRPLLWRGQILVASAAGGGEAAAFAAVVVEVKTEVNVDEEGVGAEKELEGWKAEVGESRRPGGRPRTRKKKKKEAGGVEGAEESKGILDRFN